MATLYNCPSPSRLRGELLESLIVEIRFANEAYRIAKGDADQAIAGRRLQNALRVFDDLIQK